MLNKNGVSPVVAIALLLITAVVAVVGFQGWFQTYSSGVFVKVEQDSESGNMNTQIEALVGSNLYIKNGYDNLTITDIKVNGRSCNITQSYTDNITEIDLGNCTDNLTTSTPEIVVITDNGILSKKIFVKEQEILPKVITYSACPTTNFVDEFNGVDGDLPNTMWWKPKFGAYATINNSMLYVPINNYGIKSNFSLIGDFDINIHWEYKSMSSPAYCYFTVSNDSVITGSSKKVYVYRESNTHSVTSDGTSFFNHAHSWNSGYFRLNRVGSDISVYESSDGVSWAGGFFRTFTNVMSSKAYVSIHCGSSPTFDFSFDNFTIVSADSVENLLCED